ncbi:MAG: flagellar protein FlgN [Deltaproteobacteria bacterium]|nr:flagellar protein FlgN [Deltaproteobacteria bacterium]MCK5423325.1 flagellar protein FlgN [Deltaproteobacteria bacterium]MCK5513494.1 flagellar protein FlgN [Deltaproteobacteria bacterium]
MDTLLSELITILNKEIELHKQLLLLLQNDRHFLIDLSTEEIFENIKKKETCTLKIKMLEESRSSLVDRLSQHCAIPSQEMTLSKIVSLAKEPYRSSLATSRSSLTALIRSIKEISQVNHFIIKDSLYYFQRSLDFLNNASAASPTYVNSGKIKDPTRFGSLLAKEI